MINSEINHQLLSMWLWFIDCISRYIVSGFLHTVYDLIFASVLTFLQPIIDCDELMIMCSVTWRRRALIVNSKSGIYVHGSSCRAVHWRQVLVTWPSVRGLC